MNLFFRRVSLVCFTAELDEKIELCKLIIKTNGCIYVRAHEAHEQLRLCL